MNVQIRCTGHIVFSAIGLTVLSAVQFYGKFCSWTIKVQNIRTYTVLAEESHSEKLFTAHLGPEGPLCLSLVTPQFFPQLLQCRIIS